MRGVYRLINSTALTRCLPRDCVNNIPLTDWYDRPHSAHSSPAFIYASLFQILGYQRTPVETNGVSENHSFKNTFILLAPETPKLILLYKVPSKGLKSIAVLLQALATKYKGDPFIGVVPTALKSILIATLSLSPH